MIVLDTNVVSALMRDPMDAAVAAWIGKQPPLSIWVTAITVYECRFGIARLAPGRRREMLQDAFTRLVAEDLGGRVLAFGEPEAEQTAALTAARAARGRPGELRDSMIAGIVKARRARLSTRNIRHFEDAGIDLIDPWET